MKNYFSFVLWGLSLLLAACSGQAGKSPDAKAEPPSMQAQLQAEVMAIHDEVMPKTGKINQLSRELRAYLENHAELPAEQKTKINQTIGALEEAEEAMMDWMASYGGLTRKMEEMKPEEIMQALETEKVRIGEVREKMLSSIAVGEQLSEEIRKGD